MREASMVSALFVAAMSWLCAVWVAVAWLGTNVLTHALVASVAIIVIAISLFVSRSKIAANLWHAAYVAALQLLIVQGVTHLASLLFVPMGENVWTFPWAAFSAGLWGAGLLLFAILLTRRHQLEATGIFLLPVLLGLVNCYFVLIRAPGWS